MFLWFELKPTNNSFLDFPLYRINNLIVLKISILLL